MWYFVRNTVAIGAFALAAAIGYTPDALVAKRSSSSKPMLSLKSDVASVQEGGTVLLSRASASVPSCRRARTGESVTLNWTGEAVTKYVLDLLPGEYYIAMSAIDAEGNERSLSNEVRKLVQRIRQRGAAPIRPLRASRPPRAPG